MIIQSGYYQHYKGEIFLVLGLASHTKTEEKFVIYTDYEGLKIEPLYIFTEYINGTPKFRKIKMD